MSIPDGEQWYAENYARLSCGRLHKTRRGHHLLYRMPDGTVHNSTGQLAAGVDVRGDGGYIVWWPAHSANGELQAIGDLDDIAPPPPWLEQQLSRPEVRDSEPEPLANESPARWTRERKRILEALAYVEPLDYDRWVRIGMALHLASAGCADGFHLWHAWSRGDITGNPPANYVSKRDCCTHWSSFHDTKTREQRVTLGTLFKLAIDAGYSNGKRTISGNGADHEPLRFDYPQTSLASVAGSAFVPTTWLYRDLFPIGAFLIVGRPKVGKSWLLLQLAMCAGAGADFLNFQPADTVLPGLYIASEDNEARLQKRISTIGEQAASCVYLWNAEQLQALATQYSAQLTLVQFLEQFLDSDPELRFVLIDTEETRRSIWKGERQTRTSERITQVDYSQTRAFDQLALRRKVFIGLVNHTRKGNAKQNAAMDPHELINRTNTALAGCSGSAVLTNLPDADPLNTSERRRIFAVRGRDLDDDICVVVLHDKHTGTFSMVGKYYEVRQADVEQLVLEAIAELQPEAGEGWIPIHEVAAQADLSKNAVKLAFFRMRKANRTTWNGQRLETKKGRGGGVRLVPLTE